MFNQTIFALSSARGKAAVSIFRLSGRDSLEVLSSILRKQIEFIPGKLVRGVIYNPKTQEDIDEVMFVYFKSPNSYTGEDVVEIHTHGSLAISNELTETILSIKNVRYAEAGEFTRRAVLNGKMDLTSAEGLIDLINSETYLQKKQASRIKSGELFDLCQKWREELIKIMSLFEAYLDFPDEDIPESVLDDSKEKIDAISSSLKRFLVDGRKGERMRDGLKLAIYGKPNVGKSSLTNYLTKRDVSIVSEHAGTTRDLIETHLDINGYPIILVDTAGLNEESDNVIELEGIKRAKQAIEDSDIKIFMQISTQAKLEYVVDSSTINLVNKVDVNDPEVEEGFVKVSVKKAIGLEKLINKIGEIAVNLAGNGEGTLITRTRHRICIENAYKILSNLSLKGDLVLVAEDLRVAAKELSLLIGKVDIDEILDEIFSSFCIGK